MKSKNIDDFLNKIYDPIKDFEDQILGKKYGSDRQIYDYKITIASLEVGEDEFMDRGHEEYQLRLKKTIWEFIDTKKKDIWKGQSTERRNLTTQIVQEHGERCWKHGLVKCFRDGIPNGCKDSKNG